MNIQNIKRGIRYFSPSYFALVMSTGIISVASNLLGYHLISYGFFILNNIAFYILAIIYIVRLLFFFPAFKKDMATPAAGAGFLTIVAATCIVGIEHAVLKNQFMASIVFWGIALVVWLILIYSFFILVTIRHSKSSLEKGINGSWLLFIVSAQALSILGNMITPYINLKGEMMLFISLSFYLLGLIFYLIIIGIIFYRFAFLPFKATDYKPSYWINMGAAAISTLAGPMLIQTINHLSLLPEIIPVIKVLTIFFWIAGTWWIPIIIFLEIWSHRTEPVKYHPRYWSMVFPLGVYTTCTWYLSDTLGFHFLKNIPLATIYIAWIAWAVVFLGMIPVFFKHLFSGHELEN